MMKMDQTSMEFIGIMTMALVAGGLMGYVIGIQQKKDFNRQHKTVDTQENIHDPNLSTEQIPTTPIPEYLRDQQPPRKYFTGLQFRRPQIGQITEAMKLEDIMNQ
jgi:hypothetical protein